MLLIISEYFGEKNGPAGIVVEKFVQALIDNDFEFYLISSGKPPGFKNATVIRQHLLPLPYLRHGEDRRFARACGHPKIGSWGVRAAKAACAIAHKMPWRLILAWSNPISPLFIGLKIREKTNLPIVWRFDDPYPPYNYPAAPEWKPPLDHMDFERAWLTNAMPSVAAVSAPSRQLADWMLEKLQCSHPAIVWPHIGGLGVPAVSSHHIHNTRRKPIKLTTNAVNIAYLGRLSNNRDPSSLLQAIRVMNQPERRIVMHFFGSIHVNWKKIVETACTYGDALRHGNVGYQESLLLMERFDALVLLEASFEHGVFLPSKFCDYAWAGKPLLIYTPQKSVVTEFIGAQYPGLTGATTDSYTTTLKRLLEAIAQDDVSGFTVDPTPFAASTIMQTIRDGLVPFYCSNR